MTVIYRKPTREMVYSLTSQMQPDGSVSVIIRLGSVNEQKQFEELLSTNAYIPSSETAPLYAPQTEEEKGMNPMELLESRVEHLLRSTGRLKL